MRVGELGDLKTPLLVCDAASAAIGCVMVCDEMNFSATEMSLSMESAS
jgi:hypothetical protein